MSSNTPSLFVGDHQLMQKIYAMVRRVASSDATVLISGESGTGKELVARSVHNLGSRASHPFVPINCAALPDDLLESELFGHTRGAFSGAVSSRVGMFLFADGGTIFLDEIGEMAVSLQAKLLRVLQSREVRPVGADRSLAINVRVITATNKDLAREVEKGTFREDLFYRLQVIPIHLPPLRARRSDIPLLVRHFLEKNSQKHGSTLEISNEAMVYLWEYDWPGNVREVENLIERMVVLSDTGRIGPEDIPPHVRSFISEKKLPHTSFNTDGEVNLREVLEQFEGRLIDEALRRTNGNRTAAAQMLGLKRTTLVAKLRRKKNFSVLVSSPEASTQLLSS
ncbi:MAG: sigma-54-dependent Fis family transcriptional regulator [Deltaproteobacteria bacterium]|nr:sigma-54-dependent Fis family transcriptional regulator [Deltaproteobacteria bacterium]